ncbi:MAG TPA: DUF6573 family protein [Chthoniobacterales bacterium]
MNSDEIFGEPISIYTRAQALADGMLVDVTSTAREAGWRWPVAVTAALWQVVETIPSRHSYQSAEGRLWDVVWMASRAAKASRGGDRLAFELIMHRDSTRKKYVHLIAHVGPGDDPSPVVTIGFPEDF